MVRFDYACKKCEKTFVVWSDEAKRCAYCGSKRVFKVFLTPPAASTGNAERVDKLAEQQLEAAGLSNYTNAGGSIRRTFKTDPKQNEAIAAAKAENVPFIPATGPNGRLISTPIPARQHPLAAQIAARGKGQITPNPRGTGALVNQLMQRGRVIDPLAKRGERIYHKEASNDSTMLQTLLKK